MLIDDIKDATLTSHFTDYSDEFGWEAAVYFLESDGRKLDVETEKDGNKYNVLLRDVEEDRFVCTLGELLCFEHKKAGICMLIDTGDGHTMKLEAEDYEGGNVSLVRWDNE